VHSVDQRLNLRHLCEPLGGEAVCSWPSWQCASRLTFLGHLIWPDCCRLLSLSVPAYKRSQSHSRVTLPLITVNPSICKFAFCHILSIGAGMIFRLGEQKINGFSVGDTKICKNHQDNQIQSRTSCNMFLFKNGTCSVQWGLGLSPEAGEFARISVLTFNCSYKKICRSRMC